MCSSPHDAIQIQIQSSMDEIYQWILHKRQCSRFVNCVVPPAATQDIVFGTQWAGSRCNDNVTQDAILGKG
ncbi:hypothetical protein CEXT_334941 [Caerostris extrusa]|uniref:Uncharacterized protein n=1 Tax=Caerostris extrusa TaxID=172846 RepID=A0AAV4TNU9_CAEEX|nr:hypothetical protein CEXT_334941 [Caerostris extrusa]